MNGLVQTARELTATALPTEFEALAPPPLLLPGEHLDQYHAVRQAIFADLAPRSAIEWLLAIDIAELSWDIRASLSTDSAQARVGRPLTPVSVAGVARRQNRRAAYGCGAGVVGAGVGAAAVGTAAAVAATQPRNWGGTGYYGRPYVGSGALAANASYGGPIETQPFYLQRAYPADGPWYGHSGWAEYKARGGIVCDLGTMIKGPDGLMHVCQ